MLPSRELTSGKSYVNENEGIAREVVELGRRIVKYKNYDLNTGKWYDASHACTKKTFIQWADREATPEETSCLQLHEADELYKKSEPAIEQDLGPPADQIVSMARNEMNNRY